MALQSLRRFAGASISADDLYVRYRIACDLKQPVERGRIAGAIHRWCSTNGLGSFAIQFVTTAEQKNAAARHAGASRIPWDARIFAWDVWAARDPRAAWAVRHAWDASAARVAWDASAARDAWDASAARVARVRVSTAWADALAVTALVAALLGFVAGAALDSRALSGSALAAWTLAALALWVHSAWSEDTGEASAVRDSWDAIAVNMAPAPSIGGAFAPGNWAAWDLSYVSCAAIRAASEGEEAALQKWLPLLEAFEAGAFCLWIGAETIYVAIIPFVIAVDHGGRLHCADGPAFAWLDDIREFYWHGVNLPDFKRQDHDERFGTLWRRGREGQRANRPPRGRQLDARAGWIIQTLLAARAAVHEHRAPSISLDLRHCAREVRAADRDVTRGTLSYGRGDCSLRDRHRCARIIGWQSYRQLQILGCQRLRQLQLRSKLDQLCYWASWQL